LLALAGDPGWAEALQSARPAIVPGLVLAEVDWHLRARRDDARRLLREVAGPAYAFEPPTVADLERAAAIDEKFKDLALGVVDASVAALGERLGVYRILTIDSDFAALRVGPRWDRAFELPVPLPTRRRPGR
jgi:predicted nucleic acid-binding protein